MINKLFVINNDKIVVINYYPFLNSKTYIILYLRGFFDFGRKT